MPDPELTVLWFSPMLFRFKPLLDILLLPKICFR
jgi:hypothetical protein